MFIKRLLSRLGASKLNFSNSQIEDPVIPAVTMLEELASIFSVVSI